MPTTTVQLSAPKTKTVHGYTLQKMPLGKYLEALDTLERLPGELVKACFPDKTAGEVAALLTRSTADGLIDLFTAALKVVPGYAISLFAALSGIPEERLLADPRIGLTGLIELLAAWLEVNEMENFLRAVHALSARWTASASQLPLTGFSGLWRRLWPWASAKKS